MANKKSGGKKKGGSWKSAPPARGNQPRRQREDRAPEISFSENVRLNKYLSNAGLCSRREADVLIGTGVVSINGKVVTELGTKVMPGDVVKLNGETIRKETLRYVLLNKPKNLITSFDDARGRKTVMPLIEKACKERIYPVGKLERDTTGLLLFTNDGDLTKKLTNPKKGFPKLFNVTLHKRVKEEHMQQFREGVQLEFGSIKVEKAEYVEGDPYRLGVEIHSGQNKNIRRMFEEFGYKVVKLDRTMYASLTKKDLPRGHWRHLTANEVAFLKMLK